MSQRQHAQQVFRGSVQQCWEHYRNVNNLRTNTEARLRFCEEFRLPRATADKWFKGYCPQGLYRIRMEHFLAKRGYSVTELDKVDSQSDLFKLRQHICDGELTFEQIQTALGYKSCHTLLHMLYGEITPVPKKRALIPKLIRRARDRQSEHRAGSSSNHDQVLPKHYKFAEHSKADNSLKQVVCTVLPAMLAATIPLLEFLVSDEGTEVRIALCEDNTKLMFDFTNLMGALHSDMARERYINSTSKRS